MTFIIPGEGRISRYGRYMGDAWPPLEFNIQTQISHLKDRYSDRFVIKADDHWLMIRSKTPIYKKHFPTSFNYEIERGDYRPTPSLADRSRKIWLPKEQQGNGITHIDYCDTIGIWKVGENGRHKAFDEISPENKKAAERLLKAIDSYVFKQIPELKDILR